MALARRGYDDINPLEVFEWYAGNTEAVPDIIEFVVSDRYLNRPNIYPRQATLLKLLFLQDDLFTQYDYDVIGEWTEGFRLPEGDHDVLRYKGNNGIQPDVLDRLRMCKEEGRKWFRESVAVVGRRGSKGHIGGLAGSYVIWNFLAKGDPHGHYGVDRDKRLTVQVFAGKKDQAKGNQWRDLVNMIIGSECFAPYVSKSLGESLTLFVPHDFVRMFEMADRDVATEMDRASIEIVPKESTLMAGRGPASFLHFWDEMAHIVATGANRAAADVYEAASPSLDQFGVDAFIWEGSSPWQMIGQFYENYQKALQVDPGPDGTLTPAYPEMLMVQLTSWDLYKDWERTLHSFEVRPAIRLDYCEDPEGELPPVVLPPLRGAIQEYDEQLQRLERANPEGFAVERRSHWAAAIDAYLDPKKIEGIWRPWDGRPAPFDPLIQFQQKGLLGFTYKAHGDPSSVDARFGFAIAHTERGPDGMLHAVFDLIHAWDPADYPDHHIDYQQVEEEIWGYIEAFMPESVTFDQFNSVATIQSLRRRVHAANLPKRVAISERTATRKINWQEAQTAKVAINLGFVHAPFHADADLELTFLQDRGGRVDHPTSGPVQTKDIADCMFAVIHYLLGEQMQEFVNKLLSRPPDAGMEGGMPQRQELAGPQGALEQLGRRMGHQPGTPKTWVPPGQASRGVRDHLGRPVQPGRRGWGRS